MQRLCFSSMLLALALACLWAQTPTGTIQGIVTDI